MDIEDKGDIFSGSANEFIPEKITKTIVVKEPRLDAEEKLYVKAYLATLSHPRAHEALKPGLKKYKNKNLYSKRESVQYHINKQMILKMETMSLEADDILSLLLQEATRLGAGSSPTARVQALSLLGKQLGLFRDKEIEKDNTSFTIINYSDAPISIKQKEEVKQVEEIKEKPLPNSLNLKIETYSEDTDGNKD